jgi:hypothetical protein
MKKNRGPLGRRTASNFQKWSGTAPKHSVGEALAEAVLAQKPSVPPSRAVVSFESINREFRKALSQVGAFRADVPPGALGREES